MQQLKFFKTSGNFNCISLPKGMPQVHRQGMPAFQG